jgi:DNA-binding SARP family transcriptional activator
MHSIEIRLFAKLDIRRGEQTIAKLPAKTEELLCYLLLRRGQPHTREALACELWADTPAAQSKKYLRQCLWQLQQALDLPEAASPALLHLEHEWVGVHPDAAVQSDVAQFEQAFIAVRDRPGAALSALQAQGVQQAAALYAGDLLTGWYQNWCLVERARYEAMFFALLDKLIDYCCAERQFDQGIAYGMRLLRSDRTHERTHRQLMRLYHLAGDRSMALRQFEQCAEALAREFGLAPTEQTLALVEQIRAGQLGDAPAESVLVRAPDVASEPFAALLAELASLRRSVAQLRHELAQLKHAPSPEREPRPSQ